VKSTPCITHKALIYCADTKQTYEAGDKERPQIWQLRITVAYVDQFGCVSPHSTSSSSNMIELCVERQTIVDLGLKPQCDSDKPQPEENKERPIEEFVLELLGRIGIHPSEEG